MYACVVGRQAGPRALLHALHHYVLWEKIRLADFNLAVSTPTAKPPIFFPAVWYIERRLSVTNLNSENNFAHPDDTCGRALQPRWRTGSP